MVYEIVMPQLSDSMDEGKLIDWKFKKGDHINSGDVIAEIESDKAVMEVQSFKKGIIIEQNLSEGESAPVGTVIARIDTDAESIVTVQERHKSREEETAPAAPSPIQKAAGADVKSNAKTAPMPKRKPQQITPFHQSIERDNFISPKAKAKAAAYGLDIYELAAHHISGEPLHTKDIEAYLKEHYFTPKALKLVELYHLDLSNFDYHHKINSTEVDAYIKEYEIPISQPLDSMQKAIIANVTASSKKPVYHIFEHIDSKLFEEHAEESITLWLVKIFSRAMMKYKAFRSTFKNDTIQIWPNASLSIAVANSTSLYMPVIKNANTLSTEQINTTMHTFKKQLADGSFSTIELQGSTFGISNLGMRGVESFDALINKTDAGIAAIGSIANGKISVTLTLDHRLVNGFEAALFMQDIKKEALNPLNFNSDLRRKYV